MTSTLNPSPEASNPPTVEDHGGILVVRDDLLPGGTKVRFLPALFAAWPETEFVYGGPAQGYAQVAMGYAARRVGKRAAYFVAKRARLHPLSEQAARAGTRIVQVPYGRLTVVKARARAYAAATGARDLPFGFDCPEAIAILAAAAAALGISPPEVWCVAGSGMLSRSLQVAWPAARHYAVQIGSVPSVGNAALLVAPERFEDDALSPPPFPSCSNYDAKAWRFVRERACPGALFWNVAA